MSKETTLVLFKTDCVQNKLVGEILNRFEKEQFTIRGMKMIELSTELLEEHYSHVADRPFFPEIVNFMQASPVIALALEGDDVVSRVRELLGPTNSDEAEKGTIVGPILTEYGYHVIKVNDKRTVDSNEQVNASHILLTIQPGRGTENELKDTASIFALEATEYGFFALADSLGLEIQDSNGLRKESIFVDNFGVGRSAVNFAFNNVEGSTSDVIKNDNFFGVFFLDRIEEETVLSFENVKEDLKNEFLSEFKKNHLKTLAQSIKEENQNDMNFSEIYKNNQNLEYVAEANSALIGSFESIGKSNFIVGALSNAKEGDIIGPLPTIRGEAFVRVIDIADVVMSDFEEKKDAIKFSLLIDRQNAIWVNWLQALRDNADLKDYRYDFY